MTIKWQSFAPNPTLDWECTVYQNGSGKMLVLVQAAKLEVIWAPGSTIIKLPCTCFIQHQLTFIKANYCVIYKIYKLTYKTNKKELKITFNTIVSMSFLKN